MMETQRPIDPEVVGIMQEVMSQPGSTLFNVPTHAIGKPLRIRDEPVSVGAPFLSKAERHLLEVYRDEVADVLLQACRDKLTARPAEETMMLRPDASEEELRRARADRVLEERMSRPELREWLGAFSPLSVSESRPVDLAARAIAVRPSDEGRICQALAYGHSGDHNTANELLFDVLDHRPAWKCKATAHFNLGFSFFELASFGHAMGHYREASLVEPDADAVACWFANALLSADRSEALEASALLDSLQDEESIVEHESLANSRARCGKPVVTSEARALWDRLGDDIPTHARRVGNVYF